MKIRVFARIGDERCRRHLSVGVSSREERGANGYSPYRQYVLMDFTNVVGDQLMTCVYTLAPIFSRFGLV